MRGFIIASAGICLALWNSPSVAQSDDTYLPDAKGCKVFVSTPQPNNTVTWSGRCLRGYADGNGVIQLLFGGKLGMRAEGTLVRGKLEGQVSMVASNGIQYVGTFHLGEASGKGAMTWPNRDRYEGDWVHSHRTGTGVVTRANGDRYEGDFIDGKWTGKGTFTNARGDRYSGDWLDGRRTGTGIFTRANGDRYEGEFVDDKRSGKGTFTSAAGDRYSGDWLNDRYNGTGSLTRSNGEQYEGTFVDSQRSGTGTATTAAGDRYSGDWLNNSYNGNGVLTIENGDRYEGAFVDGKASGKGTYTSAAGDHYSGDWVNNKREGQGEAVWRDGSHYQGAFVNDMPADPKLVIRKMYSITENTTGSLIPKDVARSAVPPDKGYEQLSNQQKLIVKARYGSMPADDAPPYPVHGPQAILEAAATLDRDLLVSGEMELAVTVSEKGVPLDVQVLEPPKDYAIVKPVSAVLMSQKYTPASCQGMPCQMQYLIHFDFKIQH